MNNNDITRIVERFKDRVGRYTDQLWAAAHFWRRFMLPPEIRQSARVTEALKIIHQRWPEATPPGSSPDDVAPVFICAAGWGSGSTLVQRLLMSSGEIMVWGEVYDRSMIVARLADSLTCIDRIWPADDNFVNPGDLKVLSHKWIANLMPLVTDLRHSHRAILLELLGKSAARLEFPRWGYKEVRFTIHHARYLKWLFPNARFVFVYRNLYSSYQSCKGVRWYSAWPKHRVKHPVAFAMHWKCLLKGYLQNYRELDALVVRYEDLVGQSCDLKKLANHVGVDRTDPSVLEHKLGVRGERHKGLSHYEKAALQSVAGRLLRDLGYKSDQD